jgi:hypothetical protein
MIIVPSRSLGDPHRDMPLGQTKSVEISSCRSTCRPRTAALKTWRGLYPPVVRASRRPVGPATVNFAGRFRPRLQSLALGLHCLLWQRGEASYPLQRRIGAQKWGYLHSGA